MSGSSVGTSLRPGKFLRVGMFWFLVFLNSFRCSPEKLGLDFRAFERAEVAQSETTRSVLRSLAENTEPGVISAATPTRKGRANSTNEINTVTSEHCGLGSDVFHIVTRADIARHRSPLRLKGLSSREPSALRPGPSMGAWL